MTDQPFALTALHATPDTVPDALDRLARIDAVKRLLDGAAGEVRDWLIEYGNQRVKTDGGFNVPIKGVGRTYLDQPEGTFHIRNRDVCATWLAALDPEAVEVVYRPRWPDVPAGEDPRTVALAMVDALDRPSEELVERVVVIDEDRAIALARANGDYDPGSTSTVRYVEPDTGAVWATGVEWTPARDPRLTVKIDPAMKTAMDDALARAMDTRTPVTAGREDQPNG